MEARLELALFPGSQFAVCFQVEDGMPIMIRGPLTIASEYTVVGLTVKVDDEGSINVRCLSHTTTESKEFEIAVAESRIFASFEHTNGAAVQICVPLASLPDECILGIVKLQRLETNKLLATWPLPPQLITDSPLETGELWDTETEMETVTDDGQQTTEQNTLDSVTEQLQAEEEDQEEQISPDSLHLAIEPEAVEFNFKTEPLYWNFKYKTVFLRGFPKQGLGTKHYRGELHVSVEKALVRWNYIDNFGFRSKILRLNPGGKYTGSISLRDTAQTGKQGTARITEKKPMADYQDLFRLTLEISSVRRTPQGPGKEDLYRIQFEITSDKCPEDIPKAVSTFTYKDVMRDLRAIFASLDGGEEQTGSVGRLRSK